MWMVFNGRYFVLLRFIYFIFLFHCFGLKLFVYMWADFNGETILNVTPYAAKKVVKKCHTEKNHRV